MCREKANILLDTDVYIHLYKAGKISLLNDLFENRIIILDIMFEEWIKNPLIRGCVENLITYKQAEVIDFPTEYMQEFRALKRSIDGLGERACLIYCKYNKGVIASSNTSEILPYCEENSIEFLTTLDIFAIAIYKRLMTPAEVNEKIKEITKNNGSYLCCTTIEEHLFKHFEVRKYEI